MSRLKADLHILFSKEDHWEILEELSNELEESSVAIFQFRDSLQDISANRDRILEAIARVNILVGLVKMKFSFLPPEWNIAEEKEIRTMMEGKSQVTENWGEMEF